MLSENDRLFLIKAKAAGSKKAGDLIEAECNAIEDSKKTCAASSDPPPLNAGVYREAVEIITRMLNVDARLRATVRNGIAAYLKSSGIGLIDDTRMDIAEGLIAHLYRL